MSDTRGTLEKLEAALKQFREMDPGFEYYSFEYLDHPDCYELYKLAGEIVELSAQKLTEELPNRIFQIAYSAPPQSKLNEMAEEDAARRSLLSFIRRVTLLEPILFAGDAEGMIRPVILGLGEISKGGESPYFGKSRFEGAGNKSPTQVAVLRIAALSAYKAGRKFGIPAHDLQQAISNAYESTFDTIRKWDAYCRKVTESELVFDELMASAEKDWFGLFEQGLAFAKLEKVGKQYRRIWRSARK